MEAYKTFRLRGIPGGSDEARVKDLVRSALKCSDDVAIRVRSLADDPYPDEDEMMATLEFSKIPDKLKQSSREVSAVGSDLVFDSHFFDFTTLHTPAKECTIDIVAVSGLNGHPFGSFKQKKGSWIWLRDALARDLPNSRVLTFGLDTELVNSESFQNIADLGGKLRTALRIVRTDPKRPLVLIGHSLGGIIVKEAVNQMAKSHMQVDQASFRAIAGIMFFGAPNQGMAIKSLVPMVGDGPNRALLESLGPNSHVLRTQSQAFLEILNSDVAFHVVNFYETKMSPTAVLDETTRKWAMSGPLEILVQPHSATHGRVHDAEKHHIHPVDCPHRDLVKFSGRKDSTYRVVVDHLKRMQEFKPQDMKSPEEQQLESGLFSIKSPEASRHHSVTILVDALDEAGDTAASIIVKKFKRFLATVNIQGRIKICFSCRHYPQITLDGGSTIIMEDFNADDISNVIDIGMSEFHFTRAQKQLLRAEILERSKGVFQWTSLVLDSMIQSQPRGYSFEETLELVRVVPADLHDLYKSLLRPAETPQSSRSEHHMREQQRTLKLFQWVLFAIRPLSPSELQHALALDWRMGQTSIAEYQKGQEFFREEHLALRIKDLSKGLIHISGPFFSGRVQFIHQSCLKFLLMSDLREAFDQQNSPGTF
ncbi:hypothetical protein SLS54_010556 [Diplodia seriata]